MQGRVGAGAGQGGIRPATAEPPRRYDPSMYAHLQSWETQLPPSDKEPETQELPTLPLASGSTQLWSQTVRAGGSGCNEGGEYTSLLQHGLGDDDDGGLDLSAPASRLHSTSVERSRSNWPARNGAAAGSPRVECARPSMPERTTLTQSDVRDVGACGPPVRPVPTVENITRGVSNMRAHSDGGDDDGVGSDDADERLTEDVDTEDDKEDIPVRPLGKTGGRGRARNKGVVRGRSVCRGSRGCVSDDSGKSVTYWSPEEQLQLVRCKREQEMHLAGLGHNYRRMRTKDWKWDDIAKRMASAGKPKDADDCMKKWDNLFQNYKKIQRFQNASGRPDFFGLTNEERKEHNFKFRMERALYNEIHAGMLGNHTIFPPNIADTGNLDGVQLPRRGGRGGESVSSEAGGEAFPEERSSARESENNAGSGDGGGKRKNERQQALESIADVMDRHGELMSSTIESSSKRQCSIFMRQCDILDQEVAVQKKHYAVSNETQRMMCHALMEIAAAILGVDAAGAAGAVAGVSGSAPPVPAAKEEGAVAAMARDDAHGEKRSDREGGEAGSNRPRRGVLSNDLVDRAILWVDDKPYRTTGEGRRLYNIVHETREYFVAIASGLPPPAIPRSIVMPKSSTRIARIVDPSLLQQATSCASAVENIALCVLHGWVFKSRNRPRGYNLAFQYALESVATDIVRAMQYGEEWCNVVSPAVCAHTIDLSMDLQLWFAGVNVENKPDDDDMAVYQESTIICAAHAFRVAVQMGAVIDGEFISHDRLCRVADCFRLLLAACMWIMRMAGNDPGSHFEAFYFATLVSKSTLVASMHRSFDHRRSIGLAVKAITERFGKANATFGEHPDYLPRWANSGIVFGHDARIDGLEEAKKLDRLGSGPVDDDNDDDGKGDA
ncbi:hypothetical protein CBR_g68788 [Chara braunii]|uniref:Myb-like domain-containing protein n=1 Tax=Chara braunii TaxID=69332 RepID=A0A388K9R1_CHABU|nr:hypothetical protein CBR_g68788 [Chara braunii]|eukprot:GBG66802.1 hypothetical protein CBR_g68788 [Chara braunii]